MHRFGGLLETWLQTVRTEEKDAEYEPDVPTGVPQGSYTAGAPRTGGEYVPNIYEYKKKSNDTKQQIELRSEYTRKLWCYWYRRFDITCEEPVEHYGILDSIVCATVACLFHHEPEKLHKLRHDAKHKTERVPFYVITPGGLEGDGRR